MDKDNIDQKTLTKYTRVEDVPSELRKYIWKINENVDGKLFIKEALCDEKTEKYLNATIENLGYVDYTSGWEEELEKHGYKVINTIKSESVYINATDVELLEIEKNNQKYYGLQYSMQTAIDDYSIITHILNKYPNNLAKITAELEIIDKIEFDINLNNWKDNFKCWECGNIIHWLDGTGNGIVEKYNVKKDLYCGC